MKKNQGFNIYDQPSRRPAQGQNNLVVIICLLVCLVCVIAGIFLVRTLIERNNKSTTDMSTETTLDPNVSSTESLPNGTQHDPTETSAPSPDLQTVSQEQRQASYDAMVEAIEASIARHSGRYGVYYLNLSTDESYAFHEADPFVAASSIKLSYNALLFKKALDGDIDLEEQMAYNAALYPEGDLEYGTGTIQNSPNGTTYRLSVLSHLSLTISDNCATNMIIRRLGGIDEVNTYLRGISAVVDYRQQVAYTDYRGQPSSGRHRTSAYDLALYTKDLYDLFQKHPLHFQPLINSLSESDYNWGLPAGVPSDIRVAHKAGFNSAYGTNNDVGIVFTHEDYVLCVVTESGNDLAAQALVAEISSLVYNHIDYCYN